MSPYQTGSSLSIASKGRYGKEKAIEIRNAARDSIGSYSEVKSLELQQTIQMIQMMGNQIRQVEAKINPIVDELHSPILTIPGISYRMAAIIIAETKTSAISISQSFRRIVPMSFLSFP